MTPRKPSRPTAVYRRGYEAALRKVWREFTQKGDAAPAPQVIPFATWRSWCLPKGWPR